MKSLRVFVRAHVFGLREHVSPHRALTAPPIPFQFQAVDALIEMGVSVSR